MEEVEVAYVQEFVSSPVQLFWSGFVLCKEFFLFWVESVQKFTSVTTVSEGLAVGFEFEPGEEDWVEIRIFLSCAKASNGFVPFFVKEASLAKSGGLIDDNTSFRVGNGWSRCGDEKLGVEVVSDFAEVGTGVASRASGGDFVSCKDVDSTAKTWIGSPGLVIWILQNQFLSGAVAFHGLVSFGKRLVEELGHVKDSRCGLLVMGYDESVGVGSGMNFMKESGFCVSGNAFSTGFENDQSDQAVLRELSLPDSVELGLGVVEEERNDSLVGSPIWTKHVGLYLEQFRAIQFEIS